jgi:hypothetical protein
MIDSFLTLLDKLFETDNIVELMIIKNDQVSPESESLIVEYLDKKDIDYEIQFGGQEVYPLLVFAESDD